jgi:hypothetical protein
MRGSADPFGDYFTARRRRKRLASSPEVYSFR